MRESYQSVQSLKNVESTKNVNSTKMGTFSQCLKNSHSVEQTKSVYNVKVSPPSASKSSLGIKTLCLKEHDPTKPNPRSQRIGEKREQMEKR